MSLKRELIFFRLLVNKYFPAKPEALCKIMPKETYELLATVPYTQKNPHLMLFNPDQWLHSCDASWFEPFFSTLPEQVKQLYLAILPQDVALALQPTDAENGVLTTPISEPVKQFLLGFFHRKWQEHGVLPKDLLSQGDLSVLLKLNKQELLDVVDLLAMYDLIDEVRHIVDRRILQTVIQLLTPAQQQYLRACLRQKSKSTASGISLRDLLKDPKRFPMQVHKRGLQRLALALAGSEPDFLWYISHAFDMPRAKFLLQNIQPEEAPGATSLAKAQIQQVLQFLKIDSTP